MEHDGLDVGVGEQFVDAQHHDGVIARRNLLLHGHVHAHARAGHEQGTALTALDVDAGEAVAVLRGEHPRRTVVFLAEHADAQVRERRQSRPRGRGVLHAERDERRVERDRHESARRHPDPLPVHLRADRDDARGDVRECLTQRRSVESGHEAASFRSAADSTGDQRSA